MVNNHTLFAFCNERIGRADIEGSKSNVDMNSWLPQASYPCGNFSDTSSLKFQKAKGSIGHAFTVCIHTENQNQESFYPFVLRDVSVVSELPFGHLVLFVIWTHRTWCTSSSNNWSRCINLFILLFNSQFLFYIKIIGYIALTYGIISIIILSE